MVAEQTEPQSRTPAYESPMRGAVENTTKYLLGDLGCERTGELQKYLAVVARFPALSLFNHHLIFAQCPAATQLATYEDWNGWGYSVLAKQHSRRLWDGERFVTYFDETQVRPREDARAELFERPKQAPSQVLHRLKEQLLEEGINPQDYVGEEMSENEAFHRLIAGCAEAHLSEHPFVLADPGRVGDCHVEAATSIVSQYFGFAPMPLLSECAKWGSSPKMLREELELTRQVATILIRLLDASSQRRWAGLPHLSREQHYRLWPIQQPPLIMAEQ